METIYDKFRKKDEFEEEIRNLAWQEDLDFLDTIILWAERNDVDLDIVHQHLNAPLIADIERQCEEKNLLKGKKKKRLDSLYDRV